MTEETDDLGLATALRSEFGAWAPQRGPDVAELMRRAEAGWRRPVALASSVGAVALALLLMLSVVMVLLAPAIPGGEEIRAHLVAR